MGLFSSIFGKSKASQSEASRTVVLDQVLSATKSQYTGEEDLKKVLELLGTEKNYRLKVDAFNRLVDEGRSEWAEALATAFAKQDDFPVSILRAIAVQYYLEEDCIEKFLEPSRRVLKEFPSETDLACAVGRAQMKLGNYKQGVSDLRSSLESAPESQHIFGIIGELMAEDGNDEDAIVHLRTALEIYQEAFKLQSIVTDELQEEEFEFTRLYGLLEEVARRHYGDGDMQQAFETITITAEDIGVRREGDRLAGMRVEFKPRRMEISSVSELEELQKNLGNDLGGEPEAAFLLGSMELRQRDFDASTKWFRKALQLDIESHGAYYGWAASGELQRVPDLDLSKVPAISNESALQEIVKCWDVLLESERSLLKIAFKPVEKFLDRLLEKGTELHILPLDVRLRDVFDSPQSLRFDRTSKNPPTADAYSKEFAAYLRIDAFMLVTPKRAPLGYQIGHLVWDVLNEEERASVRKIYNDKKSEVSVPVRGAEEYLAIAIEIALQNGMGVQSVLGKVELPI